MIFEPLYVVYGVVFIATLLFVEALYYFFFQSGDGRRRLNRRLKMLDEDGDGQNVLQVLRRSAAGEGPRFPGVAALDRLTSQAGLTATTHRMLVIIIGFATFGFALMLLRTGHIGLASLLGGLVGGVLPLLYLRLKRRRRLAKFGALLPDALDLLVRSLRAGHPVSAAMGLVAREMQDPVGTEFGIAVDEMTYGLDLTEALKKMEQRIPHRDLQFMIATVNIQYGTGGNLAEILANLSGLIRDRMRMVLKVKALSAEGRISAYILTGLPFFIGAFIALVRPEYFKSVENDPIFFVALGIAGVLLLGGVGLMYKLIHFKI